MRRVLLFAALLIGLSVPVAAEEQAVTLAVDKMFCAMCPITVTKAMEKVDGVSSVKVDYETRTAVVIFEDTETDWQTVALASTNAGYPARLAQDD